MAIPLNQERQEDPQLPASRVPSTVSERSLTSEKKQEQSETSIAAIATKARTEIEAGYVMSRKFPRNEDDARIKTLKTCGNSTFAESAKYKKPIGNTFISGPSIRLAEEIARNWGNLRIETTVLYEDSSRRIIQVTVIDLESGLTQSAHAVIEKVVERKSSHGREVISERLNSYGQKVSLVVATDDEVLTKANAMASKLRRNLILQAIPVYITQDALIRVETTLKVGIKENPDKIRREVADNFAKYNIMPSDIEKYLDHPFQQVTPDELVELKQIYITIKDGETTWSEVMAAKEGKAPEDKTERAKLPLKPGDPGSHTSVKDKVEKPKTKLDELKKLCDDSGVGVVDLGYETFEEIPEHQVEALIVKFNK